MNVEEFREYCIIKKGVEESFPFDNSALVFKVMGKMFALSNIDDFKSINLKCNPEKAVELRESYNGITPGYHMNKKHWNSVNIYSDVDDQLLKCLIDDSYDLVVKGLTRKLKEELANL